MPIPSSKERGIMIALVFIAIAVLVIAFVGIQKNIRAPFARGTDQVLSREQAAEADRTALKAKDTDKDGLSDYDELFVYETSPYLADTDSDSYPDLMEVKTGNDPNCPRGKFCGASGGESAPPEVAPPASDIRAGFDPVQVRALLRASGVSDEVLSKVDDAMLKKLYEESLNPTGTSTTSTP